MIKVLIVEDDPMVAKFNRRYLEQVEGFELQAVASSVPQALKVLEEREIDLILLDIYMPGLNGLELLSEIRNKRKGVDVIVISAACDMQSVRTAFQYGAVDYLIKPFEFERFLEALASYREEALFIKDQATVSQEELDKLILHKDNKQRCAPGSLPADLPKGLARTTLKMIWETIRKLDGEAVTTEELAQQAGISRVSMRKYLSFLAEIGVLDTELVYGPIGRPRYQHRYVPAKRDAVQPYI